MSLREKFMAQAALKETVVNVPEVGDVLIREITSGEFSEILARHQGGQLAAMTPELVIACVRDPETKESVFTRADIALVNNFPPRVFAEISRGITQALGVTKEGAEALEKNSAATVEDSSSSPSPVS